MTPTAEDRDAMRALLESLLARRGDTRGLRDQDSLFDSGRLASIDTLEVAVTLETRFGIDFSAGFDRDELDSLEKILELIATRGRESGR